MSPPAPPLADYFVPASLLGLLRRRHPYDFIETYRVMKLLYGYDGAYVNLGLWDDDDDTRDAGRKLALAVLDRLQLAAGDRLIDVGSGLGQAAVDACQRYQLASVVGLNPNHRQRAFATELARRAGLSQRIEHRDADASGYLQQLPLASCDAVVAVESVGHLADADGFLAGAHRAIRPGGRLGFCLNVANRPLTAPQRLLSRVAWGFVPASAQRWIGRLERAGFTEIERVDLTARVLEPATRVVRARLAGPRARDLSFVTRQTIATQATAARRAVARGTLGYALITARRA